MVEEHGERRVEEVVAEGHGKSVSGVCVDGGGRYASQWARGVGLLSARQCADGWGGRRAAASWRGRHRDTASRHMCFMHAVGGA